MADAGKAGAEVGVGTKALAVIARGQNVFQTMPPKRRTGMLASGLMLAAVIAGYGLVFQPARLAGSVFSTGAARCRDGGAGTGGGWHCVPDDKR